jgi:hypothetical protein
MRARRDVALRLLKTMLVASITIPVAILMQAGLITRALLPMPTKSS